MKNGKYTSLDILVIIVCALMVSIAIARSIWIEYQIHSPHPKQGSFFYFLNESLPLLAIFTMSSILTWMIYGGAHSPLWRWLPPLCFCFWTNYWQRWVIVVLMTLGVIIGMMGWFLGPF